MLMHFVSYYMHTANHIRHLEAVDRFQNYLIQGFAVANSPFEFPTKKSNQFSCGYAFQEILYILVFIYDIR